MAYTQKIKEIVYGFFSSIIISLSVDQNNIHSTIKKTVKFCAMILKNFFLPVLLSFPVGLSFRDGNEKKSRIKGASEKLRIFLGGFVFFFQVEEKLGT